MEFERVGRELIRAADANFSHSIPAKMRARDEKKFRSTFFNLLPRVERNRLTRV